VPVPLDDPMPLVPFSEADPYAPRGYHDDDAPANLTREHYPPYLDELRSIAADFSRRVRLRRKIKLFKSDIDFKDI